MSPEKVVVHITETGEERDALLHSSKEDTNSNEFGGYGPSEIEYIIEPGSDEKPKEIEGNS